MNIRHVEKIASELVQIHEAYDKEVWNWTTSILMERFELDVKQLGAGHLLELLEKWESETIKMDKMILNDASKEFDNSSKIGFGLDGDAEIRDMDFEAVRGTLGENKFILGIEEEIKQTGLKANELKKLIQDL